MVPALGFGTAPMLGRQSRKQSLAALQYAYSRGIRHFDTARSYGWGEAEKLLGEFLRHYPRQDYVLVGKCGIVPPQRTQFLSAIKAIGRNLVRAFPGRRNLVQKIASSAPFAPVRTYDIATLQESVDTTFRELNCSYLDVLLLHNFDPAFEGLHDIIAWMRK